MLVVNLLLFLASLAVLVKSASYAVNYCSKLARMLHISEFMVSFFVIAVISCSPEATVSIVSALSGEPEFGLGTLLGSNVADLALVFGIVALASCNGVKVKSEVLKNDLFYLALLLVPLLLGFDGNMSRTDGIVLLVSAAVFLLSVFIQSRMFRKKFNSAHDHKWKKKVLLLLVAMAFLVVSAYYTVQFGVDFANDLGIPPFLVALTMVAIGTCMPELMFSLKAVKCGHDELALGDVLGTVIIDATLLVGIISLIRPFDFDPVIIYTTGMAMFIGGILAIAFIRSGKVLSRREGVYLLIFYMASLVLEFVVNNIF